MISAVRRLKDAPSEAKCQKIAEMLDQDHDGALDLGDVGMVSDKCYHYMEVFFYIQALGFRISSIFKFNTFLVCPEIIGNDL